VLGYFQQYYVNSTRRLKVAAQMRVLVGVKRVIDYAVRPKFAVRSLQIAIDTLPAGLLLPDYKLG
jgi:hypothetical protein